MQVMRTEIIYEDNDILVVYKPAGLPTQTAKLGQPDVVSQLKNHLKQPYLGIIHRLDQPVEGLLVFAKHKKAAADLTAQLQCRGENGSLHKHYYAVVCGKTEQSQGRLVDYMYKSPENVAVIVDKPGCPVKKDGKQSQAEGRAKEAILEYHIVARQETAVGTIPAEDSEGKMLALADIHILTGRFHQIRAQMAHAGMPLLGDVKYGSEESKNLSRALRVQTVALCAYRLEFRHPVTKKSLCWVENPRGKSFGFFSKGDNK